MQDIHEESLNESVKSEQSPRVVLWEIDLTGRAVSGIFSVMS
ncbi:phage tail protein [Escherichia coli]|nr:phage tail protein [Escherichia coli]